ncbi:AraC family transcriptional regulator [Paenibacillus koleovorans]|uniref:AraC family transcriptional regulator n=1 Tax=Paenibacillus koleovorans TaxID=121608 RepID=UPI000FDA81B8|nr:AraC family transcriptional regulator [Paenibacillus koleovorans]
MTTFPIFQDNLGLHQFKKGELPLFATHFRLMHGYPNHHHEFVEISFVTQGEGTGIINGIEYPLTKGSISLLLPHHLHAMRLEAGASIEKFTVMFDVNLLFQPEFAEIGQWLIKLSEELVSTYDLAPKAFESMQDVLTALITEHRSDRLGKHGLMRIKLLEAVYLFFRSHPGFSELSHPVVSQSQEWDFIKYVNTHFLEDSLSLEQVASKFGVSIYTVRGAFKRLLGKNFLEYLHLLRVRRASSLLAATDMSVSEIAYDVGFSSFRSFTRVFKETTGLSATDYRNTHAVGDRA